MYFLISLDIEVLPLFIVYQLARYESKFWKIFLLKLYITITNRILIIGGHCVKYELYLPLLNARGHSYELSFVYLWLIFQLDCTAQQNYLLQPLNHWNDTKYIRSLFTNLYEIWPPKIWYSCVNSPKICLRLIIFSNDPISFSVLSKRVCSRQIPRSITNIGLF